MSSVKTEFLELVDKVKRTGISERLYSAKNPEELKKIWQDFISKEEDIIRSIQEWENEYLDSMEAYDIFAEGEDIENAMEIAICIRLMNEGGNEIYIFENENTLSDALGKIDNYLAKYISIVSYEKVFSSIQAEEIFKNIN